MNAAQFAASPYQVLRYTLTGKAGPQKPSVLQIAESYSEDLGNHLAV